MKPLSKVEHYPANAALREKIDSGTVERPYEHRSVLTSEVLEILQPTPGKLFVDGTIGGGGHTAGLLNAGAQVIGLDRDEEAISFVRKRFHRQISASSTKIPALRLVQANFRDLLSVCRSFGVDQLDGLLLDLGVSSPQLDHASRGFSIQQDGPLDMRMDQTRGESATDWIASADESNIQMALREYGELSPSLARKITNTLVASRKRYSINTTESLANLVQSIIPRNGKKIHPATRVFQAIRIAVNDEFSSLQDVLAEAAHLLKPGGRLAVISFHSLEDRIVKNYLKNTSQEFLARSDWSIAKRNPRFAYRILERKARTPNALELKANPRSRSARLRWAVRI